MKTTKSTISAKPAKNEDVNWNAKYYREKAQAFYNSSSYSAPSEPVTVTMSKSARKAMIKAGVEAAQKVRHFRPANTTTVPAFVMISGIPHKMKDGKLVPLTPKSK